MLALGGETSELAVRTVSGLVLNVGQTQGQWGGKGSPLLQESSRALLNLASWLCEEKGLLESVYPEMKGPSSDLATLTQFLALEAVTPGSRDTLAKPLPLSASGSDLDLVVGRLLRNWKPESRLEPIHSWSPMAIHLEVVHAQVHFLTNNNLHVLRSQLCHYQATTPCRHPPP